MMFYCRDLAVRGPRFNGKGSSAWLRQGERLMIGPKRLEIMLYGQGQVAWKSACRLGHEYRLLSITCDA